MRTPQKIKNNTPENLAKAFNSTLRYLSYRIRSTKEIKDYLIRKNYPEEISNKVINQLEELKFLDDKEFAKLFAESRQRKGKSKKVISFELTNKGIDKEFTEKTLESIQEDLKTAKEYIEKRIHQFDKLNQQDKQKKIINRLRFRGFSWEIISKILKQY